MKAVHDVDLPGRSGPPRASKGAFPSLARRACGVVAVLLLPLPTSAAGPTAAELAFERNVRPILVEHCQGCHGPKKQMSGLRVDSRQALLAGGDNGPALEPGDPDASRLIQAVRHTD